VKVTKAINLLEMNVNVLRNNSNFISILNGMHVSHGNSIINGFVIGHHDQDECRYGVVLGGNCRLAKREMFYI
jgi:hypothetical protein